MNKVASDLKNFAPQAPAGMEERIQKALSKKKSFWAFSWYTMNVYVIALVGTGLLALVFANRGESNLVAQSSAPASAEVKAMPSTVVELNANSNLNLNEEKQATAAVAPVKSSRQSKVVRQESQSTVLEVENCQTKTIVEPATVEVAENIEVQRMPEEIQVPKVKNEVVKPKGRSLKLTRLTGK